MRSYAIRQFHKLDIGVVKGENMPEALLASVDNLPIKVPRPAGASKE
jgi:hypothetical protein